MQKIISFSVAIVLFISCSNSSNKYSKNITAAGATFPLPFYSMAFKAYKEKYNVNVNYNGIGSGGGIRSLKDNVVDFCASDAFLDNDAIANMPSEVVHIPTCIGAVVIAYNIPNVAELKLTPQLLSKIFMGEITNWNDSAIVENNSNIALPDLNITVIHRSDGSGTTQIFSDYMSKISENWNSNVGSGKSLNWPTGMGAKGNPGVAGTISQTAGSIGYIGSEFAFAQKISMAKLQNCSGNYIEPSIKSISAAANSSIPKDTRIMLTNSSNAEAYPICGFTWLIIYKNQLIKNNTSAKTEATIKLLNWIISPEAQEIAKKVHYAPLPEKVVAQAKAILQNK